MHPLGRGHVQRKINTRTVKQQDFSDNKQQDFCDFMGNDLCRRREVHRRNVIRTSWHHQSSRKSQSFSSQFPSTVSDRHHLVPAMGVNQNQIQLSQLSGTMHSRTRPTRPWRDFCADHPTDAIPPWKRQYDTISPCGAQGWKRAILLKMWGGYFSSFLGLPGFRFAGMSAEGFRPSAASISSSFGLTLTSRQPPSSPTRTFFARFKSDMMRE